MTRFRAETDCCKLISQPLTTFQRPFRNSLAGVLGDSVVLVSRIPPKCHPSFTLSGLHTDVLQLFYTRTAWLCERFLRSSNFKGIVNNDFIDFSYLFFRVCRATGVRRLALLGG